MVLQLACTIYNYEVMYVIYTIHCFTLHVNLHACVPSALRPKVTRTHSLDARVARKPKRTRETPHFIPQHKHSICALGFNLGFTHPPVSPRRRSLRVTLVRTRRHPAASVTVRHPWAVYVQHLRRRTTTTRHRKSVDSAHSPRQNRVTRRVKCEASRYVDDATPRDAPKRETDTDALLCVNID